MFFGNFKRIWPESKNFLVRSLNQKIYKNKSRSARHLKFSQNVSYMISLKARKFEAPTASQIFFIAIYIEGGVNLPHPPEWDVLRPLLNRVKTDVKLKLQSKWNLTSWFWLPLMLFTKTLFSISFPWGLIRRGAY